MKFPLLASAALISFFSISTFADPASKPDKCPSVEIIRQIGLNDIRLKPDNTWVATNQRNDYGSHFEWTFVLGSDNEKVKNADEAKQRAMQEMETLILIMGPLYSENGDTACLYDTKKIKGALAITPPLKVRN